MSVETMAMRHILLVGNRYPCSDSGGTETLTHGLATALTYRGNRVSWLAESAELPKLPSGVQPVMVAPGVGKGYPARWQARESTVARRVIAALDPVVPPVDIVHITHFSKLGLSYIDIPALRGKPVVATLTDYTAVCADYQLRHRHTGESCTPNESGARCSECVGLPGAATELDRWKQRNVAWLNQKCSAIWVQTPHQRIVFAAAGVQPDKIVSDVAHYPIPGQWAHLTGTRSDTILFVGRASPEKGLDVLLAAFAGLPSSARLTVVTRPDDTHYEARLRAIAARDPRMTWLPPMRTEELGALIASAGVLAVPSQWRENHPLVVQYAFALGTTVLSSDVPSMRHLAEVGDIQYVAPTADPIAWRHALAKGNARPGRNRVDEFNRNFDGFVDSIAEVYDACLGR